MLNIIQADLFCLRKATTMKILFAIATLGALVMTGLSYALANNAMDEVVVGIGSFFVDIQMISLLAIVLSGVYICGDFTNKTMATAISIGTNRFTIVLAKMITFSICIGILLIPYIIVTIVAMNMDSSFSAFLPSTFMHLLEASGQGFPATIVLIYLTAIVVYVGQLCICVLLAFWLQKSTLVIGIGYGISFLSGQVMMLGNSNETLSTILSYTPFSANYIGLTVDTEISVLLKALVVSILFVLLMTYLTYQIFKKKELK